MVINELITGRAFPANDNNSLHFTKPTCAFCLGGALSLDMFLDQILGRNWAAKMLLS